MLHIGIVITLVTLIAGLADAKPKQDPRTQVCTEYVKRIEPRCIVKGVFDRELAGDDFDCLNIPAQIFDKCVKETKK